MQDKSNFDEWHREIYMIYAMLKKIKGENTNFISPIWITCNGLEVEKSQIIRTWPTIPGFEDYQLQRKIGYL